MKIVTSNNLFLLEEIIKKNFSSKYKDSVLGILWSFIKPLLLMILLTIIFSALFRQTIENYPVYVLSGKCIYDFFNTATTAALYSLKSNENILKRTAAPKFIFVLGAIFSEFINFLITLIILFAVMIVTHSTFRVTMVLSIIPVMALLMGIIGFGLMLSIICVYYRDIQHIYGVFSVALMYASALFYPMDILPNPFHDFMILNPLYWVIEQFRDFIYIGVMPDTLNIINTIIIAAIFFVLGIIIFKKYGKNVPMKF